MNILKPIYPYLRNSNRLMTLALLSHIRGDTYSGAERLFSDIAKLLRGKGFEVICCYATSYNQSTDELCLKPHGIKIINTSKKLERVLDSKYSKSRTLLGFHHSIQLKRLVEELHPELVFVAHEAFKPLELSSCNNKKFTLMHYVHNPYEFVPDPSRHIVKFFNFLVTKYIIKESNFSDIILANSLSTRYECIKRWNRKDCIILHPAIKVDEIPFSAFSSKEDICIVLSRIAPEKRIELAIKVFSTKILQDKRLFIIGYVSAENKHYYHRLIDLSKENSNIKILPNLGRADLLSLLSKAKVFFHPRPNEHFGIATIEAMAAGCLPVVHASRGPLEVVNNGEYGLTYTEKMELPRLLNDAFSSAKDFQHKLRNRAIDFDIKNFQNKFDVLIDRIHDNNKSTL
jgi:glycosyltransferase involved in cell wall biosynthesis